MKRLTYRENSIVSGKLKERYGKNYAIERLAEYEDTGYTPDEIIELRDMDRCKSEAIDALIRLKSTLKRENTDLKHELIELTAKITEFELGVGADAKGLPAED